MTPRERAKQVVIEAKNHGEVKVAANGSFRERIAQAITAAVEQEREETKSLLEKREKELWEAYSRPDGVRDFSFAHDVVQSIRLQIAARDS